MDKTGSENKLVPICQTESASNFSLLRPSEKSKQLSSLFSLQGFRGIESPGAPVRLARPASHSGRLRQEKLAASAKVTLAPLVVAVIYNVLSNLLKKGEIEKSGIIYRIAARKE